MSDIVALTAAQAAAAVEKGDLDRRRAVRDLPRPRGGRRPQRVPVGRRRGRASRGRRERRRQDGPHAPRRRARSASRTSSAPRASRRRPARGSSRATARRTRRRSCASSPRRARRCSARRTRTSSRWARRTRTPPSARCSTRGTAAASRAARAAAAPPPWPPASRRGRSGTDTGGSIRQPAALCGIVGLKPTYGSCSRFGMIAFASSLDQAGPLTRDVTDAALLFGHMVGRDDRDATSIAFPEEVRRPTAQRLDGIRLGVPDDLTGEGVEPGVMARFEATLQIARDLGATVERVPLPHADYGLSAYYVLAPAEASSNLARFDGVRYGLRRDADDLLTMYTQDAPRRLRRRGQAPHPHRHLRAVERLLRRLLRARAARAHEDRRRLPRRLRAGRLHRHADEPERRLRARRARRRTRWRCTSTTTSPSRSRSPASRRSRSRAA